MRKLLFDLFPLLLFFVAYRLADIYTATAVAMVASVGQLLWLKLRGKAIEVLHWVNLFIILVFGGATLWLQSEVFIMWKPTVLYWMFGVVLAAGMLIFRRNLLQQLMNATGQLKLPDPVWTRLAWAWSVFFIFMGAVNLFVAFSGWFTEAQWVSFKVFGLFGLMIVFVIGQSIYLAKHLEHENNANTPNDKHPS